MGRKRAPKANVMPAIVEPQPSGETIKLSGALNSQHELPLPMVIPLKRPNFFVDGVDTHHEKGPEWEQVNQENGHQKKSPGSFSRKKSKFHGVSVRRSERIKSAVVSPPNNNYDIEYIEDIIVSENERDEADTQMQQALVEPGLEVPESEPEPEQEETFGEKTSLDEKVNCVLHRIEALDKIVRLLKSKIDEKFEFYEAPSMASASYRSMYIDSQKKIEALTDENQRLNGKLENALGKIEVYEKEIRVLIDVMDKTKDAVNAAVISNLAKTIEAAVSVSTQAIQNACPASAAKRKRNES